ncbi:MAG: YegP family protein [Akkermansiaceae bacterium]|nr:YegP family protein [Akkermansiaceae bacterium]
MFEVYQSDTTEKFHFRLKASNGEIIFTGQGYKAKADCLNGIESVRKNAAQESHFEVKEAKDGRKYFTLKASNGQVIGQSQMYKSDSGLKGGIASVQKNCAADCKDLTA